MNPDKIVFLLVENDDYFIKVIPHIKGEHFEEKVQRSAVEAIKAFYVEQGRRPTWSVLDDLLESQKIPHSDAKEYIHALKGKGEEWQDIPLEWAIQETESFIKKQEFLGAIVTGYEAVERGEEDFTPLYKVFEQALSVSLDNDLGHDYVKDWRSRLEDYNTEVERIPFFSKELNRLTNGGFERGRLNFVVSKTSGGKTMFLVNVARHLIQNGYNVVYITLEDGEVDISRRLDAQFTGVPINAFTGIADGKYEKLISSFQERIKGRLRIKYYITGMPTVLDFKAYLRELQVKDGFKPDVVIVDYMNLMSIGRMKGHGGELYGYYKAIAEELAGFAKEQDVAVFTATQFNRSGARTDDPETEDVSDSIGTMFTARFAIALVSTKDMREAGIMGFKLIKSKYGGEGRTGTFSVDSDTGIISDFEDGGDVEEDEKAKNVAAVFSGFVQVGKVVGNVIDSKVRKIKEEIDRNPASKRLYLGQLREYREKNVTELLARMANRNLKLISTDEDIQMRALEKLFGEEENYLKEELALLERGEKCVNEDVRKAVAKWK